ncbi:DNA-directed RNA polymerase sigma-70 factor [Tenacibaculum sp. KUL152]|uniref:RNA polymerase sigma factor n=1 Tax=Alteromonas sp. KUL106 TaxID=2480799 RepID=UPI0012E65BAC|nr:sigma-70 family RNA polymerase sigma factor [Alteromonas sp. KUL106]GFD79494.1 DNA-directed RNA polymerase sigma-70 factor [Tenacibaculum sp. KUL118]GFD91008.1 DNA-directed RNA polymerase sigma-70 factor [Tenacibaculum sp. KUL152]GFD94569.1 DNA-directed RNA polymerase sigma-70 factor [Alteromonas sp. KUL154]GFD97582.1 DNA-directed RNA polymerase sigma-70 factor [Alteromonas sp. KUL156]GFD68585.1 DNA-directed RNA polymerase sigma-70 factor [Alteromonas sp. KUL106]
MQLHKQHTPELTNTSDHFLSLFLPQKQRIYGYIFALVQNPTVADDVFQDVSGILWQEFNSFIPGSSFAKWSNAIVYNCVRTYRHKNKRYVVGLNEDTFEQLTKTIDDHDLTDSKWAVIQSCLSKLTASAYRVYHGFYIENLSAYDIAKQSGRSIYGVRKSLMLVRKVLFECVEEKNAEADR